MYGRDLTKDPTIPGHEASLTIVGVGANLRDRWHIGQRVIVQPDIYYQGKNLAWGYMLSGGFAQYSILGKEVLEGDEGCYLLPVDGDIPYAAAALTEPWACVEASYRIQQRPGPRPGGTVWLLGQPGNDTTFDLEPLLTRDEKPERVILTDLSPIIAERLLALAGEQGIRAERRDEAVPAGYAELTQAITGSRGFDDVICLGVRDAETIAQAARQLARGGVFVLSTDKSPSQPVSIDVGRIHYDDIRILTTHPPDVIGAYTRNLRVEPKAGGRAWFLGAGGPMGQMHVLRAATMPAPPRIIAASNLRSQRLDRLTGTVCPRCKERGIQFYHFTREALGEELYHRQLHEAAANGFDDIVVLASSPSAVADALAHVTDGTVVNVFAGLPRGTEVPVDMRLLLDHNVRIIGSSGSRIDDLRHTLEKAVRGELQPHHSVVAVASIEGVHEGLQGVAAGRFPGKVMIYPQVEGLRLTMLEDLKEALPEVYNVLDEGPAWSGAAEEALLEALWQMP